MQEQGQHSEVTDSSSRTQAATPQSVATSPQAWGWPDVAFGALLLSMAAYLALLSWRKWPDPIVDFGHELYLPWRISEGAVLYRDLNYHFGPFSLYLNALVFKIFGVGLTSLIVVNLATYVAILGCIYYLARAGWGRMAAFSGCAFFVEALSFSHIVGIGNYNYLTPYTHAVSHGLLLVLLLIIALRSCLARPAAWKTCGAGLLAGTSVLLKPEIIMAAGVATLGFVFLLALRDRWRPFGQSWPAAAAPFLAAGLLPMLLAAGLFWALAGMTPAQGLRDANCAWISVIAYGSTIANEPMQQHSFGTDQVWANLFNQVTWGPAALCLAAGAALECAYFSRSGKTIRALLFLVLLAAGVFVVKWLPWTDVGSALPGLLLFAGVMEWRRFRSGPVESDAGSQAARVLLWLTALALIARMALNPRIYHYGFFQAALAAVVGIAALAAEMPALLQLSPGSRRAYQCFLLAVVLGGGGMVADASQEIYRMQTQAVGDGPDRFYAPGKEYDPQGYLLEEARKILVADPGTHSLLVLPEGAMLNYLARKPGSTMDYLFTPSALAGGREREVVGRLEAAPPDRIVIISRDMREFGMERFGDKLGHGWSVMEFIYANYRPVVGAGDPLDPAQRGLFILARQTSGEAAAAPDGQRP